MKEINPLTSPKDYFGGLAQHWKSDILAGAVVSLIALPMCLSISQASGFPAIAGIYTAVIGGILITFIAGSFISIKGPAGGLSAIALGAVETLGSGDFFLGYKYALATIVVSGLIQIIFGLVKAGNLGDFFPSSVIHGMLASLGLMMAIKQVPILLGVSNIKGKSTVDMIIQMPDIINRANPEIALIGFISLAIMVLMALIRNKYVQLVPSQLVVLLAIIPLTLFFSLNEEHSYIFGRSFQIDPKQALVELPDNFLSGIINPDFSVVFTRHSLNFIILFALVGSIESVLSDKATDKLDTFKRKTDNSRDLIAIGIGNVISGFLGGLPMISESKRSVINLNNGAKTRWSNFFHGVFLVGIVLVAVPIVELIPHAALSAMLIFAGLRMAAPKTFITTLQIGREQLIVFNVTILASIFFDILIGIGVGVLTELIIHVVFGVPLKSIFKANIVIEKSEDNHVKAQLLGAAIFSNFLGIKKYLDKIPKNSEVTFDFSKAVVVDHSFLEHLSRFEDNLILNGGSLNLSGLDYHKHLSDHPLAAKRMVKTTDLSSRQINLENFCASYGYEFDLRTMSKVSKYQNFDFFNNHQIHHEENTIRLTYKEIDYDIADLTVSKGEGRLKQNIEITRLYIPNLGMEIPEFTLEQENYIESITGKPELVDIDFEEFPNFSYYYLLKGRDEKNVRKFFTKSIIKFFEINKGYKLESNNGGILIYKKLGFINTAEIAMMIMMVDEFIDLLKSETV